MKESKTEWETEIQNKMSNKQLFIYNNCCFGKNSILKKELERMKVRKSKYSCNFISEKKC